MSWISDRFYGYQFLFYSSLRDSNSLTSKCLFFPTQEEVRRNEDTVIISAMACLSLIFGKWQRQLPIISELRVQRTENGWGLDHLCLALCIRGRRRFYQKSPSPDFHFDPTGQNHTSFTHHLTMPSCKGNRKGSAGSPVSEYVCVPAQSLGCWVMSDSAAPWTICSLSGSSVNGTVQARILEWVASSFSRGSSQPSDRTLVSHIAGRFFTVWPTREALLL